MTTEMGVVQEKRQHTHRDGADRDDGLRVSDWIPTVVPYPIGPEMRAKYDYH
jgi:hypothetical protein